MESRDVLTLEVQYLLNLPCIFNTSLNSMLYLLISFTLLNKQKWMYLVIFLRDDEAFSSTTPPLAMYSLIHLDPWWCICWYILTPDDVFIDTSWPLMMYQTIHADPWQCIVYWIPHVWEIQYTIFFSQDCRENVSP